MLCRRKWNTFICVSRTLRVYELFHKWTTYKIPNRSSIYLQYDHYKHINCAILYKHIQIQTFDRSTARESSYPASCSSLMSSRASHSSYKNMQKGWLSNQILNRNCIYDMYKVHSIGMIQSNGAMKSPLQQSPFSAGSQNRQSQSTAGTWGHLARH